MGKTIFGILDFISNGSRLWKTSDFNFPIGLYRVFVLTISHKTQPLVIIYNKLYEKLTTCISLPIVFVIANDTIYCNSFEDFFVVSCSYF